VVIAIIALLIAILLPSLSVARERGKATKCVANLKDIGHHMMMYLDSEPQGDKTPIAWYKIAPLPGGTQVRTPYTFGGFKPPNPAPPGELVSDTWFLMTDERPLNKILDPTAQGRTQIDLYKDPSDRSYKTSVIGTPGISDEDDPVVSWQINGSSYQPNTRWILGYQYPNISFPNFDPPNDAIWKSYQSRITNAFQGGKAAKFALWVEQGFYRATYAASTSLNDPNNQAPPQRHGWHKEFSKYSVGYADGHAEYRYFNTRLARWNDYSIWEPDWTPAGAP